MAIIEQLLQKIKKEWIITGLSTFAIGFFTYLYFLTNHFLDEDSNYFQAGEMNMISSGRHTLALAAKIGSDFDLQLVNGLLALFYISISAIIISCVFNLKHRISSILVGGILATFPSLTATFGFTFTIDAYMLAFLLVVIAFALTTRYKFGFIPSIVLVGISLGIYQSYYSCLIALCIFMLLYEIIQFTDLKAIGFKALKYVGMGAGGYLFYIISLKIALRIQGRTLSGYQGIENLSSMKLDFPDGLIQAYHGFGRFLFKQKLINANSTMTFCVWAIFIVMLGTYIYIFLRNKKNFVARICVAEGLALVLPIGMYLPYLMNSTLWYYSLMQYSWAVVFIFAIVLSDLICNKEYDFVPEKMANVASLITVVASIILIFNFSVMANVVAFNMNQRYEKTYSTAVRVIDRLETTPGFSYNDRVSVLGAHPNPDSFPSTVMTSEYYDYEGAWESYVLSGPSDFYDFCEHYLGVTLNHPSMEEETDIIFSPEFLEMPSFPDRDCIRRIGDVWVFKF